MAFPIPAGLLESVDGKPLPQTQDTLENAMLNAQGRNGTALTMRGRIWQVGSGATTTSIPILDSNGLPVLLSSSMQAQYTNAKFEIIQAGTVELAVVTAVGASGTLTLDSALSSAPSAGAWFLLTPTEQTSLTGSNIPNSQPVPIKRTGFSINETDQSVVLNVASGANNTTLITPPVGQIWRVKTLYVNVPSTTGGTAGNHTLYVGTGSVNSGKNWSLNVANTYAANIQISYNTPFAQSQFAPNSLEAFRLAISQLVLNNSYPLVIYYNNGTTGGTQSGTMNITVISEVETVA